MTLEHAHRDNCPSCMAAHRRSLRAGEQVCPGCGCRWHRHQTIEQLYESDDPTTVARVRDDESNVVTCTSCRDCYEVPREVTS